MNCLMIETKDRRKFFTHEKNFPQLIEFSKTFNAEVSVVKLDDGKLMELAELAPAICDASYRMPRPQFEIVETRIVPERTTREKILKTADRIQDYVMSQFMTGGVVSLSDLRGRFAKHKLTSACFCNHIRKAVGALAQRGIETEKIGAGKYQIKA